MTFKQALIAIYGALVMMGGVIGFIKAESIPSLVMGSASAITVWIALYAMIKGQRFGQPLLTAVLALLALFFLYRLVKTGNLVPSVPLLILTLSTFVYSRSISMTKIQSSCK